jgi:hypothetical protein
MIDSKWFLSSIEFFYTGRDSIHGGVVDIHSSTVDIENGAWLGNLLVLVAYSGDGGDNLL